MAAVPKITSKNPTVRDAMALINAAHDCIHSVGAQVTKVAESMTALASEVRRDREGGADRDQILGERIAVLGARMERIEGALGVKAPEDKEAAVVATKRRFAGLSQWQAIATIASSMFAALTAYKFIEPAVAAGALALHHALMASH